MSDPISAVIIGGATLAQTMGAIQQGKAADAAGKAQQQAAEYQASIMAQQAGQERAVSQRKASAERKQKDLVQSRLQAVSAASGAGALDPTVVDLVGDVETQGELRALTAMYEGEEKARGLEAGAVGRRYEGQIARMVGRAQKKAGYMKAAGALASGAYAGYRGFAGSGEGTAYNLAPQSRSLFELGSEDSLFMKYG